MKELYFKTSKVHIALFVICVLVLGVVIGHEIHNNTYGSKFSKQHFHCKDSGCKDIAHHKHHEKGSK